MDKINLNSGFWRTYLWSTKAKLTMGIFFAAYTFFYLLLGLVSAGPEIKMDFFTSIEMMFAGFFIGVAQQLIIPIEKLSAQRSIIWVAVGTAITLLFSLVFRWFREFPAWCFIVFVIASIFGMVAMIIGYYLELEQETKQLNAGLAAFQSKKTVG